MGLLGLFKDNFVRIAENTTKYYLELSHNYGDRFSNEACLLATAGVIDAHRYIFVKNPKITIREILHTAGDATSGKLGSRRRTYLADRPTEILDMLEEEGSRGLSTEEQALADFIVAIEIEMFKVDNPYFSSADIAMGCYKKAGSIANAVKKTKQRYASEPRFSAVVSDFMESPQLEPVRKELGIKG